MPPRQSHGLTIKDIIRTSRPLLWLNTAVLYLLALILLNRPIGWPDLAMIVGFTLPFNLWLHGINDVYDYESDLLNSRKGSAEGALLARGLHAPMLRWVLGLNLPFLLLALATGTPMSSLLLIGFYFLGWAYSAPPVRGKSRPFLDSAINMAYILPLMIGLAFHGAPPETWPWPGMVAFALWSVASHAFTSIQDIEADRQAGIQTVATFLGHHLTACFALAVYLAAALLAGRYGWAWGALVGLYPGLVLTYLLTPSRERANRLYRLFILANSAFGFLVVTTLALANHQTTLWAAIVVLSLVGAVAALLRCTAHRPDDAQPTQPGRAPLMEVPHG